MGAQEKLLGGEGEDRVMNLYDVNKEGHEVKVVERHLQQNQQQQHQQQHQHQSA